MRNELNAETLVSRDPIRLNFSSDDFGQVYFRNKIESNWVVTSTGIALSIVGETKLKFAAPTDFPFCYNFRAKDLGSWADKITLSNDLLCHMASMNPGMVLHSWSDIEDEYSHKDDFKRTKRPFICILDNGEPCWAVLWEFYPNQARVGVYIGRDQNGLGGHVRFYDFDEFKVL